MNAVMAEAWRKRADERQYLEIRGTTEALAEGLTPEDQMVQSMPEASPIKWHLAHTTWFFETFLLAPHAAGYEVFDPRFTYLFNSYYKQLDGHPLRSIRGTFSRPSVEEVRRYRQHVDEAMSGYLSRGAATEILELVELGLNHEQQHQELMVTDLKHAFWTNPLRPAYRARDRSLPTHLPAVEWLDFEEGLYEIGHASEDFAFDNEKPRHRVYLQPFRLASRLVTNAEYAEFIADGGYQRPELWLSDGWEQVGAAGWRAPLYWEERDGERQVFTCSGMRARVPQEPVCHISSYEAEAFARWAGARLPTEAEWEVAASTLEISGEFLESGRFHPASAAEESGLQQMFGNVWQWTASPHVAYPGYGQPKGVLGEYNGKFMCNQMVLRGGACATPRSHIRPSYRNFFAPQARWQFSGIRLANDRA